MTRKKVQKNGFIAELVSVKSVKDNTRYKYKLTIQPINVLLRQFTIVIDSTKNNIDSFCRAHDIDTRFYYDNGDFWMLPEQPDKISDYLPDIELIPVWDADNWGYKLNKVINDKSCFWD